MRHSTISSEDTLTNKPVAISPLPRPDSLADTVVEALRKRILNGDLGEGVLLNQVALAKNYGISRIPLREACRQLEVQGLLVSIPGKGVIVSSLSVREFEDVLDLRAKIEPDLFVKALDNITDSDLDHAAEILDKFEVALANSDIQSWGDWNWRFHASLYIPSGRELSMNIVENLHNLNHRYARMQISLTKWERRAEREHRQILAAARRRDKDKAHALLQHHILSAGDSLIELIRSKRGLAETT